jgi:hypothetical protein
LIQKTLESKYTQVELDEKKQKDFQETLVHVRAGLRKLESQRDDAARRLKSTEEENFSLKCGLRKSTQENKDLDEAKRLFGQSLEEATTNLARLRQILEDEKAAHVNAQRDNQVSSGKK